MRKISIDNHLIHPDEPAFIIAEMSANHHQEFDEARRIIDAASEAGADAVKLQTYTPDTLTIDCDRQYFQIGEGTSWEGRQLYDLYDEAFTPWEWHEDLKEHAQQQELTFFSTPYDPSAVEFLSDLEVPAYKVASFEIIDIPLLDIIARQQKPIIMSTGMATLAEIDEAVRTIRDTGHDELVLLKCTSAYPAPPEEANLRTIPHLADAFDVPTGLSDHTLGTSVPVASVALGACVIEKHMTMSRDRPGPDSDFSLEPDEFEQMVDAVRTAEKALGEVHYDLTEKQEASQVFRRSLFVVDDIEQGEAFTEDDVRSIRPGHGMHTRFLSDILGREAAEDIERGTPMSWDLIG